MRKPLSEAELERLVTEATSLTQGLELLGQMAVVTDPEGTILYVNPATERVTGFPRNECIGKNPGDLWGSHMPKEFYEKFWQTIKKDKKPFSGEMHNRRKDGTMYWQEMFVTPVLNEAGEPRFFIALELDITKKKEREKFHEEFESALAHQLKNPLTAINWTIEMLLEKNGLRPEQKQSLIATHQGSTDLIALIEDLQTLARLGQIPAREDRIDLREEVHTLIEMARKQHPYAEIDFRHDTSPYPLETSRTLALQVFSNMITNAFEYADGARPKIRVLLRNTPGAYHLEVENNGLGISEKDHGKIFERLFRSDDARRVKSSGTGLGLHIAKLICSAFGWNIDFVSPGPSGCGTMFFVDIPKK